MTQLHNILRRLDQVTAQISDLQGQLNGVMLSVARRNAVHGVTAAKALASLTDRELVYLSYLNTEGDNGGGFFEFVAASAETADDVDVITVTAGGQLIRRL